MNRDEMTRIDYRECGDFSFLVRKGYFNTPNQGEDIKSLSMYREGEPCLLLSCGAKYEVEDGKREILSWQFAFLHEGELFEFLFRPLSPENPDSREGRKPAKKRLSLYTAIGLILDFLAPILGFRRKDERGITVYDFCPSFKGEKPVVKTADSKKEAEEKAVYVYRGGEFRKKKGKEGKREKGENIYCCRLNLSSVKKIPIVLLCRSGLADLTAFSDTEWLLRNAFDVQGGLITSGNPLPFILHSPSDRWRHLVYPCTITLRDAACLSEFSKTSSFNDAIDILLFSSSLCGSNHTPPATLTSAAASYAVKEISNYCGVEGKDFLACCLVQKTPAGKKPAKNRPAYIQRTKLEPVSSDAAIVLLFASNAYRGGYNICSEVGYFPFATHDYDLKSAYPTVMCLVPKLNERDLIAQELRNEHMDKSSLRYWGSCPLRPFVGYISSFRFPQNVSFCSICVSVDGVPCYPRTSEGVNGVYITGPELYLALSLGAEVECQRGFFLNTDENLFPLADLQKGLITDRQKAIEKNGKGCLADRMLKGASCSIYGKISQNIIPKNHWTASGTYEDAGPSPISNPVWASMITGIVRSLLIAAQNELEAKGYESFSATTDGMITNAPPEVMSSLDLYGFTPFIRGARRFLTGDEKIWTEKHRQNDLVNFCTRANMSLDAGGVSAHGGIKSPFGKDTEEDRLWFLDKALKRTGRVSYVATERTSLKDVLTKGEDFEERKISRGISLDFDMKRKPVEEMKADHPVFAGREYEMAHVKTVPFENVGEFERYRDAAKDRVLRTEKDWNRFFTRLKSEGCRNRVDEDFTILMSCIRGYLSGKWEIEPLSRRKTLKEKIAYINKHNASKKDFTETDWKNAGRKDRRSSILPEEQIETKLEELRKGD